MEIVGFVLSLMGIVWPGESPPPAPHPPVPMIVDDVHDPMPTPHCDPCVKAPHYSYCTCR